jgi:hypothetical protein
MNFDELLRRYNAGMIVASEFIPEAVSEISADNVQDVLGRFPPHAIGELASFIQRFDPAAQYVLTGGVRAPSADQIETARVWLDASPCSKKTHPPIMQPPCNKT